MSPIVIAKAQARWRVGRILPILRATLTFFTTGAAVDFTNYQSVRFAMYNAKDSLIKINYSMMNVVMPATLGVVTYTWTGTDVDTAGTFRCFIRGEPTAGQFWESEEFYIDIDPLGKAARRSP